MHALQSAKIGTREAEGFLRRGEGLACPWALESARIRQERGGIGKKACCTSAGNVAHCERLLLYACIDENVPEKACIPSIDFTNAILLLVSFMTYIRAQDFHKHSVCVSAMIHYSECIGSQLGHMSRYKSARFAIKVTSCGG